MKRFAKIAILIMLSLTIISNAAIGFATTSKSVDFGDFAIVTLDTHVFRTSFASAEIETHFEKGTILVCLAGHIQSDSSQYIRVIQHETEPMETVSMGYVPRSHIQFISIDDVLAIEMNLRTKEDVMKNPSVNSETFLLPITVNQQQQKINADATLFAGPSPDSPIRSLLPVGTEVITRLDSVVTDTGVYVYVSLVDGYQMGYIMRSVLE